MYRCRQEPSIGLKLTKKVEFAKYELIEVYCIRLVLGFTEQGIHLHFIQQAKCAGKPLSYFSFHGFLP